MNLRVCLDMTELATLLREGYRYDSYQIKDWFSWYKSFGSCTTLCLLFAATKEWSIDSGKMTCKIYKRGYNSISPSRAAKLDER